jgi:DNA-binding MarR family transcriptional regulator
MPRHLRQTLYDQLGAEVRSQQRGVDLLDEEVALYLGVNRTDLRCLDVLLELGEATPSHLAEALRLTTGSVTALVDRLEKRGYAQRTPGIRDRRSVVVRPSPAVVQAAGKLYGPLASAGQRHLAAYTIAELNLLIGFLRRSRGLQETHAERIRRIRLRGGKG